MRKLDLNLISQPSSIDSLSSIDFGTFVSDYTKTNYVSKYGESNLARLRLTLQNTQTILPYLEIAKNTNQLTNERLADFLNQYSYGSVSDFETALTKDGTALSQLNTYYQGGSTSTLIDSTSSFFSNITNLVSDTSSRAIVSDIAAIGSIATDIKNFENTAKTAIDNMIGDFVNKLSNLKSQVESIKQNTFLQGHAKRAMTKKLNRMITDLDSHLETTKVDGLKSTLSTKSAKTVGEYTNPNADNIQYAKTLLSNITKEIGDNLTAKFDEAKKQFDKIERIATNVKLKSNDELKKSGNAGRPIVSDTSLADKCAQYSVQAASYATSGHNTKNFVAKPYLNIPSSHPDPYSWSNLTFVKSNVLDMTTHGYSVKDWGYRPDVGYYNCDIEVLTMGNEIGKRLGKVIQINSAYRPPEYNRLIGGATHSQHLKGHAIDCSQHNLNRAEFVDAAKQIGFTGFGYYSSFIHVDIGPTRRWTKIGYYG